MQELSRRIEVLEALGKSLSGDLEKRKSGQESALDTSIDQAERLNPWFSPRFSEHAISHWAELLKRPNIEAWAGNYDLPSTGEAKTIGLVLAGNIPLVGLHDILSVYLTGNCAYIKPSSQDQVLISEMIHRLKLAGAPEDQFRMVNGKLEGFDAVIATGSGNTSRYFEQYFGTYPSIIRRNRTAVAVLQGDEPKAALEALMDDVFTYFGLGCRNVTKLFIPQGFDLDRLFAASLKYQDLLNNNKYVNNLMYHKTLMSMQQKPFLENGLFILTEDTELFSPVGVLHYERYRDLESLNTRMSTHFDEIQCVVGKENTIFGNAQKPGLSSYADGVDTVDFLLSFALDRLPN